MVTLIRVLVPFEAVFTSLFFTALLTTSRLVVFFLLFSKMAKFYVRLRAAGLIGFNILLYT